MSERWLRYLLLLPAAGALAIFLALHAARAELLSDSGDVFVALMYYVTGAVTFLLVPGNRAARRLLAVMSISVLGFTVAYGVTTQGASWAGVVLLQTFSWAIPCFMLGLFAVFPDGIYQRKYELGIVVGAVAVAVTLQVIQMAGSEVITTQQFIGTTLGAPDPFFVKQFRSLGPSAASLLNNFQFSIAVAMALLILRYRRFGPQLRRQIRGAVVGVAVTFGAVNLLILVPSLHTPSPLIDGIVFFGLYALLPVPLAIGIVNPRWLDVDLVIRRSLIYGVLWLLIAAAYVGIGTTVGIALGQRVPLQLAILLTIAATLVFQPARHWLEQLGDRLVFGRRLGGYQLISQLGAELESSTAPKDVAGTVAAVVQTGLGARWVRVDLNRPQPTAVALAGAGASENAVAALSAPLVHANQVVGRIECGPKLKGDYVHADQGLLNTLGRQAALSIRNSQLTAELSDRLEELAASRMRLVQADDVARRRLERDLHDGVQQQLVGLLARLGLARNQLRRDPELAGSTLRDVSLDAQRALENLQELARGIHPAVLTDRGLIEAVRERATRMTVPVEVRTDGLPPGARFASDLEGAAYFFVSEALANVLKHSNANRVEVRFVGGDAGLVVEVEDDGRGFDAGRAKRSGLRGLQDRIETLGGRLEIMSGLGSGTKLRMICERRLVPVRERLRIVIAEDNYLVREGTRRLLEDSGEVDVLASVSTAEELLEVVDGLRPDVVLTDIRMPPAHHLEGIQAAHSIRQRHPRIGVVVLSQHSDATYALQLFKSGTEGLGYLLKSRVGELDELLHALREVAAGRSVIDPGVVERLVDYRARQTESPLRMLSEREVDVLREMAEGKSNPTIAEALHLSESSVEKYINTIFSKLGLSEERSVSRRVAAVLTYLHDVNSPTTP